MVVGEVGFLEYGRELKLVWSHFVVAGLGGDAEFVAFNLKVEHECLNARGYGSEIVVLELLVLCRLVAHECASGEHEVGACAV